MASLLLVNLVFPVTLPIHDSGTHAIGEDTAMTLQSTKTSVGEPTAGHRSRAGDRLWWLYMAAGLAVMTVYFALPERGSLPEQIVRVSMYCLVSGSAAVAIWVGVRRHRPAHQLPWALLLASQVVYFAGDVSFYVRHNLMNLQAFPSISDVFYLMHYPLLVAALWLFIRRRTPGRDRPALLDGVILTTGLALIAWVFLLSPQVHGGTESLFVRLTSLAYPVMDLGVLAVALRLLVGAGVRGRAFFLLAGALLLLLAADTVYGLQQLAGVYSAGNYVDVMWLGYYLLLGAAALHPSMSALSEPSPTPTADRLVGRGRLLSLAAAALMAPLAIILQEIRTNAPDVVLAAGATVMFLLVMARMAGLVTSQRLAAGMQALAKGRARFEVMIENGSDLVVVTNRDLAVSYASPTLGRLLGFHPDVWLGRRLDELVILADREVPGTMSARARQDSDTPPTDVRLVDGTGGQRTLALSCRDLTDNPAVEGLVWNGADVTDRRALEDELTVQAFTDGLTGLANRALFTDRLTHALARSARHGTTVAVLVIDFDRFKTVNDGLGHAAGDAFLVEAAGRLNRSVRAGDTVARHGGDEFTVLLEDLDSPVLADEAADRILAVLREPITVDGTELRLSASVGVALSGDLDEPEELMRAADLAMYQAKNTGRGRRARYEPGMQTRARDDLALNADLDYALDRGELEVYYQPTVSLTTNSIDGAEALLRWHHPVKGPISPTVFIPLAERSGQIVPIGRWVLGQACAQAAAWHASMPAESPMTIAVNLSVRQLADPNLLADVRGVLNDTGLDPRLLTLEITESVVMNDVEEILPRLHALKDLGLRLAIDDFGTGYSSLAYLRRFPVDILKIDKTFIDAAAANAPGGLSLIRAVVDLGRSLQLTTVAEGVEDATLLPELVKIGCHSVQGFHFFRPMPAGDLNVMLRQRFHSQGRRINEDVRLAGGPH
jgi:diguanylate cyclase (GGDEF)-like protein/PAS domain S-box-containing protein